MADPFRTSITGPGVWQIASLDPLSWGTQGVLVQFQPDANWGVGQVQLYYNANPDGAVPQIIPFSALTAAPYTNIVTGVAEPLGTPIGGSLAVQVNTPSIYSLYAVPINWTVGTCLVITTPYNVVPATTVNFSNITIDSIPPQYDDAFELVAALVDAGGLTDA